MPKKASVKKKPSVKTKPPISKKANVEKVLIENFISLQKVMTNLAVKFDNLGAQISKLLELFEISAKTLAEKDIKINAKPAEDKKMAEKLDTLLDQNKVIARGLTLLHEPPPEMALPPEPMPVPMPQPMPRPMPRQIPMQRMPPLEQPRPPQKLPPIESPPQGGYQKSPPIKKQSKPKAKPKKNETVF